MLRIIKNIFHLISAFFAAFYYGFPGKKLKVIGITGTSGKTTTSHLVFQILKDAGKKVSMISTLEAIINGKTYDTGFHVTTPSPWTLQKFLRLAVNGGTEYSILEVTSHALDQNRIFGVSISLGLVTNIAHEHLDYHKTMENYRLVKSKIFYNNSCSLLNFDDPNFSYLKKRTSGKVISYSLINNQADYTTKNIKLLPQILGKFNLYNCLAAAALCLELGIDTKTITKSISEYRGLIGRMEELRLNLPFRVFIDFAHKPNALEQALITFRFMAKKNLIIIFGCAGLRDKQKRPIMGEIAAKFADYIILTAEDPRTEDVRNIINEIAQGCLRNKVNEMDKKISGVNKLNNGKRYFWRIPDRQEAINYAFKKLAKPGDLVALFGKGHEKSMCYGVTEYPWNERKAVEKAIYGTVKTTS
ncbi:hypothetical protein A2960_01110 [Candidatus Gottesmanbacteria bacterium RIFCSPLOWO2_01_FULL_39_12b]|uniref:UDP-N-acetylmuramyl-tripeptide synthetase n=1 Tax=Candidatus Gottesmanbacteria bacterium RIFCSPLOWO2_01_FULL_39_12b TaxID=1798388 RepID=A0A1F6APZ2_9BACT|nr:MAG: hypothetical protein A2960_01110 [Candidatus Gottesmanbacteria bacterium RIFCSPLOWO2_01_FULL_39_12b]